MRNNRVATKAPWLLIGRQWSADWPVFLKGQSHEKVGEMRVQGDSLGPN
jgi:hypothetical protein